MAKDEFSMVDVLDLKPLDGFKLWLKFSDGSEGEHDFAAMIAEGGEMVQPLRDPTFFARVHIEYGVPTWPNGAPAPPPSSPAERLRPRFDRSPHGTEQLRRADAARGRR